MLEYRPIRWLLLDGNRLTVATLVLALMLGVVVLLDPIPSITSQSITPLFYAFSALLSGNLNLLTIVVAVNQLVFSRELKSTSTLRSEIEDIAKLRQSVAHAGGREVAPATPAGFVRVLLDGLDRDRRALDAIGDRRDLDGDEADSDDLRELVRLLGSQCETVRTRLSESESQTVDVLAAMLAVDFSAANHLAVSVRERGSSRLSDSTHAAIASIIEQLEQLVLVRNHFESMYTQENLSKMSRQLLFVGIPVEFLLGVTLLWFVGVFDGPSPAGLPVPAIYVLFVLGLAPLAVVFAFVIRAVTISRQTVITTQFTPQRHAAQLREEYTVADEQS
ncbi:MAG: hypothetical protein ABEI77_03805 [Halorientalis sp.]